MGLWTQAERAARARQRRHRNCLVAQQSELQSFKNLYPKEKEVFLVQKNQINISIVNDSLVINEDNYEEQMILSNEIKGLRQKSLQYNSFTKIKNLELFVKFIFFLKKNLFYLKTFIGYILILKI